MKKKNVVFNNPKLDQISAQYNEYKQTTDNPTVQSSNSNICFDYNKLYYIIGVNITRKCQSVITQAQLGSSNNANGITLTPTAKK